VWRIPLAAALIAAIACALAPSASGGALVVVADERPDSLDPALAYDTASWQVLVNAGEGLLAYRRAPGEAGAQVMPALARAMPSVSDGGRRLTFRMRPDARFGPPADRPVRPSDVKASIERLFLAGSPGRGLFRTIAGATRFERTRSGGISGIIARDGDGEVEVRLTRPDPAILRVLALPFAFALPAGTPATEQAPQAVASAGPYRVASSADEGILLVRNPGHRPGPVDAGAPAGPDAIRVVLGVSAARGAAMVRAGEADYVQPRPSAADVAAAAAAPGAVVRRHPEGTTHYFFMNTRRPPFDDVRVRRAVGIALDRSALALAFGPRGAVPTAQVLPPGVPGRRAIPGAPEPALAAARRLVAQAGARGAAVEVWGHTNEPSPAITGRLARTLGAIGLEARPRLWERSTMLATLADPAAPTQIGYARWRQDFPDAADWYPLLLTSDAIRPGGTLNYALLADPALDRLIARASSTWDEAARRRIWRDVDRAVARRAPWAPFAHTLRTDLLARRVTGYVGHQLYGFLWMRAGVP
jgi:peptide/nickel transport system substrate-binding protein